MNMDHHGYAITHLNLLAFPRNMHPICELTGARANVSLTARGCTLYYATEELAEQAWHGIIHKIIHLLPPLLQAAPIVGTQDERNRREKGIIASKRSLIDFCFTEASNLLSVRKYHYAIPAAIQALKFSQEVDGDRSLSSVEPYLQLAHSNLGLSELKKAEEYLALARWIVLSSDECSHRTRAHLHMLVGRVSTAQGRFETAKTEFASSIYYSSLSFGPESISTAIGYFRLGDVFLAESNVESALAFFDKVVDIWFKYLSTLRTTGVIQALGESGGDMTRTRAQTSAQAASKSALDLEQLTEENISDGHLQLEKILENRRRLLGHAHIATGEGQYTLGLFEFFLLGQEESALRLITAAYNVYVSKLGVDHKSSEDVESMVKIVSNSLANANPYLNMADGLKIGELGDSQADMGMDPPVNPPPEV